MQKISINIVPVIRKPHEWNKLIKTARCQFAFRVMEWVWQLNKEISEIWEWILLLFEIIFRFYSVHKAFRAEMKLNVPASDW